MVGMIDVMHLLADDIAAVQIEDQISVKTPSHHLCRQIGHISAPHLTGRGGEGVVGGLTALGALARLR